ncbi:MULTISPECIES: pyridoxamine 5'-phosphate oxidase family protein [unclassified Breznakia]|uniref:pyridoxamine 5'-phosphate oxidase family protein n=1 Tax=unclassified Breznakia TaxID=2623764 RepID=UPI0024076CC8|nr:MULTISPECIES: pyridoxamine 5'-phosphate oxidase family protein [unclassified Breznakia]MDF9838330.1 nitroimidazol reductase NimA-like FMN-containing flavoprotein (pyridoxamine 5'-phosphate oxidase superfamily) [Breznakia sp. PFB2-8]MDF9860346.1 nitroimidazol reductase NimA-like FMN-containing flavoprotein (pyridoxamine 5'-phosphate oxidase superfamily) [Breznakia sp. PH5-24]
MRRKEKEIKQIDKLLAVIDQCDVCHLGMAKDNIPYVVPLNFGYSYLNNKLTLYFHCAQDGKKIKILKQNPNVCFEMYCNGKLINGDIACKYTFQFQSIIGYGKASIINKYNEKITALDLLMKHQSKSNEPFTYEEKLIEKIHVFKIDVISFSGKQS